jgi:endonuclease YncB( thermonuclease family)
VVVVCALVLAAGCADPVEDTTDPRAGDPPEPTSSEPAGPQPGDDEGAADDAPPVRAAPRPATPAAPVAPRVVVASVTDGDTIVLRDGRRVRLVQIDTPEVYGGAECGGRAASRALSTQLPPGTRVRLVADPATDRTDRYDRLLRYVYRGSRNLNVWMVARGHAAPYFYDGERGRFATQLERSARRARAAGLGLWGACPNAVLDAYRGVDTGRVGGSGSGGANDAAAGAGTLGAGASRLPLQPAGGPDVDCGDLPGPVRVTPGDPHRLDGDGDGVGCDS